MSWKPEEQDSPLESGRWKVHPADGTAKEFSTSVSQPQHLQLDASHGEEMQSQAQALGHQKVGAARADVQPNKAPMLILEAPQKALASMQLRKLAFALDVSAIDQPENTPVPENHPTRVWLRH